MLKGIRIFVLAAVPTFSVACVPVNRSDVNLVGRWQVTWDCGNETLDLKADHHYVRMITYVDGGRASDAGTWRVEPSNAALEGGRVILQDAAQYCTAFGAKSPDLARSDLPLETVWEWGRVVLSFNPDVPGFVRQSTARRLRDQPTAAP